MAPAKHVLGVTAIAITLMVPGLGRAQSCASDADCATGLSCQDDPTVTGGTGVCSVADGGRVCTTTPTEPPLPTKSCRPAPCTSDADCGSMICYKQTVTTCAGGTTPVTDACRPGTTCVAPPPPVPETCTPTTTSLCTYRWALPCNADVDCGTGFLCKPSEMGMCSGGGAAGSGGTASEGAGGGTGTVVAPSPVDAAPVAPPTCTTIFSYPGHCQAKVTTCTADADCPSPWTCRGANASTPVVASPVAIDGGPAVAVPPPADFVPVTKTCQPPATYAGGTRGDTGTTPTKAAGDGGATISLSSPDAGAATGATKPPTPTPPGATNSGPTETVASTSGGGGCSVSAGQGAVGSAWLVLAALALLVARRGRRRAD